MENRNDQISADAGPLLYGTSQQLSDAVLPEPSDDIPLLNLAEIIDAPALQSMMEVFYRLTNIGIGILDTEGRVVVGVGWQDICTRYHRVCADTVSNCNESDVVLSQNIKVGEFKAYHCRNHMWEMMTPIVVGDRHLGNVCLGQFFFEDETPDYELFRQQAHTYGFEESEYLAALDRVPRWSHETVNAAMAFYAKLAEMLSYQGVNRVKLAQALEEQHSATAQLEVSESKLREAQEIARIGRWELDLTSNDISWTEGIYALCEQDPILFAPTYANFMKIIHPDDRDMVDVVFNGSVIDRKPYEIEHRLLMADGRIKWVNEIGRTEYDENGNAVKCVGIVQDITEHKLHEEALKESDARFRNLLNDIESIAVQGYTPDGTTFYWNHASERLYQYSAEEAVGRNLLDLIIPPEMRDGVSESLRHMAETGEPIGSSELSLMRKDGSRVPVFSTHTLVKVPGRTTEMYCLDIDMTERKQLESVQGFLAKTSSGTSAEPFFQTLARYLATSLDMDFVCIDRLVGDGLSARTVAVWCDGKFEDNVTYALKDTPCGEVVGQTVCCFPASVCRFFPRGEVLQELRAESYVGVTVWNHEGKPIGLIAIISRRPLQNRSFIETTMKLVALRTAGELERLETEQELQQREKQFRAMVDTVPLAIHLTTGIDQVTRYVNPTMVDLFGYTMSEIPSADEWWPLAYPDELYRAQISGEWNKRVLHAIETQSPIEPMEVKVTCKDGTIKDVLWGYITLGDRNYAYGLDMTEQKQAEEALRQTNAYLENLLDYANAPIIVWDPQLQITRFNNAFEAITGHSEADVLGRTPEMLFPAKHVARYMALVNKTLSGDRLKAVEMEIQHRDGSIRTVLWNSATLYSSDGITPVATITQGQDITERIHAEAALWESEHSYREIFDATAEAIFIFEAETGRILDVNQSMLRMFGFDAKEHVLIGNIGDLSLNTPPYTEVEAQQYLRLAFKGQAPVFEWLARKMNRETFWTEVTLRRSQIGGQARILAVVRDISERKMSEAAMRESEQNYREVFDATAEAILIRDADTWSVVDVNQSMLHMYGYETKDEVIRLSPGGLSADIPGYQQTDVQTRIALAKEGQTPVFEWLSKRKNGEFFWSEVTLRSSQIGGVSRILVVVRDITDRKQAEEALRESEEAHRVLVENLPDIVIRFGQDMKHLYISNNIIYVMDVPLSQFIGQSPRELGLPELQCQFWEQSVAKVFSTGESFETEYTFTGVEGIRIYNCRLVPERGIQGVVCSVLCLCRDITAQRRAEDDYGTLFRQMLTGFALHEIICDEHGTPVNYRYLAANPAFERLTGLKADEIVGRTVLDILPDTEMYWIEKYGKVALTGEPTSFEDYSSALNKYFEVTAFQPAPNQFACIVADVTDRKLAEQEKAKLEEALQQALKMESVGRLAGGVAHDFNNMLGVILGHTQMAIEQLDPDLPLYADLLEIQAAAGRSADLTRQLLAFARKQTVMPKVLNLNTTIESMLKMLERLIGEDICLRWIPSPDIWSVKVDPSQIDQILANFCVNARDAISGVGVITIKTGTIRINRAGIIDNADAVPGDYVWFSVSDTGDGMDKETIDRIFEPFFTTKGVGEGTGLGLATVYGAVKQNNGFIDVKSEMGKGTTFTVYLARHIGDDINKSGERITQKVERGHETILLVEDEPAILRMTQTMLERLGYTVVASSSPGKAIGLADSYDGEIHLVLTDVVMPEMNGHDLSLRLMAKFPSIKRLFMSGYTSDMITHQGKLDDGVYFLQKPFSMHDLGKTIREALS